MIKTLAGLHRPVHCLSAALLFAFFQLSLDAKEPKLNIEELVAKHLDSIGTPEARAAVKTRTTSGTAQVNFIMPKPGRLPGVGGILSDGKMMQIALQFGQDAGERFVFDGNRVDVGRLQLRVHTSLADFIYHYNVMLKEGLMGGTLTTAWPFLDLAGRQPKLDYSGLKKVDGKQLHEVKYRPKKDAGDVQIALYFDPETFRHVYSEYRLVVRAMSRQGKDENGKPLADFSAQDDSFYKIQEWFDEFGTVDSLNLPHTYKIAFSRRGPSQAIIFEYQLGLSQILHNQAIDQKAFLIP